MLFQTYTNSLQTCIHVFFIFLIARIWEWLFVVAVEMRPLHYGSWQGNDCLVELLLLHGSDVNQPALDGNTPLHLASEHGHFCVVSTTCYSPCQTSADILCDRPPSYTLHCASQTLTLTLACNISSWKLAHWLLQLCGTSAPILWRLFCFWVRSAYGTDGRTDWRARHEMRPYSTAA